MQKFGIERNEGLRPTKTVENLEIINTNDEGKGIKQKTENTQLSENGIQVEDIEKKSCERTHDALDKDNLANNKIIENKIFAKKKRRTKNGEGNRNYICNICQKSYFSYPALYTHKRNKHNIIPITGKEEIFKNVLDKKQNLKFKYSALENDNWLFSDLMEFTIKNYKHVLSNLFGDKNCLLHRKYFNDEDHAGIKILKRIRDRNSKVMVPDPLTHPCIDEILIIYLIHFVKVTQDQFLIEMTIRFVILFREHLNISGWDYKKKFLSFGIKVEYDYLGPYTLYNDCEDVPDFVNDFISVFVNMDNNFKIGEIELIDITKNFCNWLFVNNLTSFKMCRNDFDELENNVAYQELKS